MEALTVLRLPVSLGRGAIQSKLHTGQAGLKAASWARFPHVTHTLPKIKMLR